MAYIPYPPPPPSKGFVSIEELERRINKLEKRLLIIEPTSVDLDKHPGLRKAWEEYKIIEKLTLGDENE